MKNNKNVIIVILCITIICMGLGFSYISMNLSQHNSKENFNLIFSDFALQTPIQGGKTPPTATAKIINSGKTIDINYNLFSPVDELCYKIIIKNEGTLKAKIIELIEYPDYINDKQEATKIYPVKITHNDIKNKVLEPGEEIELTVIAYFNYKESPKNINVPFKISIISQTP